MVIIKVMVASVKADIKDIAQMSASEGIKRYVVRYNDSVHIPVKTDVSNNKNAGMPKNV